MVDLGREAFGIRDLGFEILGLGFWEWDVWIHRIGWMGCDVIPHFLPRQRRPLGLLPACSV